MEPAPVPAIDPNAPIVQRLSDQPAPPIETVHWNPALRRLLGYWHERCLGRNMPSRADIDPIDLGGELLPHVMILDHEEASGRFRYRLLGTAVVRAREGLAVPDPTGHYVDEVAHGMPREWLLAGPSRAIAERRPIYDRGQYDLGNSKVSRYERLSLPLSDGAGKAIKVLVGFFVS